MEALQKKYANLVKKKDDIEASIKELMELVEENKQVGLATPLVDSEGYPRNDIDVYSVRHARHQIACLQNDHKAAMQEIEEKMYEIHKEAREIKSVDAGKSASTSVVQLKPFLMVNQLAAGGPADQAGVKLGDNIKQFGSVHANNFRMQDISVVVQHSQNKIIKLVIERDGKDHYLELTPRVWSGRGLLGYPANSTMEETTV